MKIRYMKKLIKKYLFVFYMMKGAGFYILSCTTKYNTFKPPLGENNQNRSLANSVGPVLVFILILCF